MRSQNLTANRGALNGFDQPIRINPNFTHASLKHGNACTRLGELQSGLRDYSEGIRLEPTSADAYFNRGVVRYKLEDQEGALNDLQQAVKYYREQGADDGSQRALEAMWQIRATTKE